MDHPGDSRSPEPGSRPTFRDSYREGYAGGYARWYPIGVMVGAALAKHRGVILSPLTTALVVAVALNVFGIDGRAQPEFFSVVAAAIPTLAIAVFVVVARTPETELDNSTLWDAAFGWAVGMQMILGEAIALWAVASASTSRLLAMLCTAALYTQMAFLIRFSFGIPSFKGPGDQLGSAASEPTQPSDRNLH